MPRRARLTDATVDEVGRVLAEALDRPTKTEREFQEQIAQLARQFGWMIVHHGGNQHRRAYYDTTGFPDLLMVSPTGRVLFRELKTDIGSLTPDQERWRRELLNRHADYAVWRPTDWVDVVATISNGKAAPS